MNKGFYEYPERDEEGNILERDKHATISVIQYKAGRLHFIDDYLKYAEETFKVEYIKRLEGTAETAWNACMRYNNATLSPRGHNNILECLQFGGNREFWEGFESNEAIRGYFSKCYQFAVHEIGYLHATDNIICAVIVTEKVRRNLFVYYLPITETWQTKVMSTERNERGTKLQRRDENGNPLYSDSCGNIDEPRLSSTQLWKRRGGQASYSCLQEKFYQDISRHYGAVRGKSKSAVKYTAAAQIERFGRYEGDKYDYDVSRFNREDMEELKSNPTSQSYDWPLLCPF